MYKWLVYQSKNLKKVKALVEKCPIFRFPAPAGLTAGTCFFCLQIFTRPHVLSLFFDLGLYGIASLHLEIVVGYKYLYLHRPALFIKGFY